ncbi:hypothetical protein PR202_ga31653 [Eleusine coracana subsp. coracana]|uniref:Transcription factor CBF/NF-Y/archaeal histone domain-containing protein n=1 Tax=Eleusine coracana subsp. coracana TaxID=191504 RepID=A0AAV5DSJ3_ELECO|nr:hypothetical protein PR202_ga31653 [Eleusine coracana subsp. coracana]
MATHPQSPKANAPSILAMEPTIPTETVVETELPVKTELPVPESTEPVIREQDRLMPIANVVRVMRRMLPAHAKVADDAKEVIQECVSEFISFVTGEANDRCHGEHRKTVTAEDIVWAMERLGFDNYVAPLKSYIQRMRDSEGTGRVFGGRGDRAHQTRAPNGPAPVPMVALHGMRAQHVAFPNAALAHGYGVPIQVPFSVARVSELISMLWLAVSVPWLVLTTAQRSP